MKNKTLLISMAVGLAFTCCGCQFPINTNSDSPLPNADINGGIVNEIEYNTDKNTVPDKLAEGLSYKSDSIETDNMIVSYCIPDGYEAEDEEVYESTDKNYYYKFYANNELIVNNVEIINYSDMAVSAETLITNDINYENSEKKTLEKDGVKYHYAYRTATEEEGIVSVWIVTCDLGDGWIYSSRLSNVDGKREIAFEEIDALFNVAVTKK